MRYIGYEELEPGRGFPELKSSLIDGNYPFKKEIVQFLQTGEIDLVRASRKRDIFTGKWIPLEVMVMHAEDFYWSTELAWYVDQYNLRLPKDFEEYIIATLD